MINYVKYRSRYASRINPITRDRPDLGSCIVETIGYEAVYDHFILIDHINYRDDIIEGINTIAKKYNINICVDHYTTQSTGGITWFGMKDKDDNQLFELHAITGISGLLFDIKNKKFIVTNAMELDQLYVKED